MIMRSSFAAAAACAFAVAACAGARAQDCPAAPEDAVDFGAPVTIAVASGDTRHAFTVEIADTPEEAAQGLMYRPEIAPDAGMLFVFDDIAPHSFYMRNTCASLDILYLRANGSVASIVRGAIPYSERGLPSPGPVKGVLEIAGGRARELGIAPGDQVIAPGFGPRPDAAFAVEPAPEDDASGETGDAGDDVGEEAGDDTGDGAGDE